ncbi:hypothetical protein D3C78_1435270 [compost metagenome]
MSATCSGTTSRAMMITNSVLRPGKRSQAKAYAAKDAIKIGITVAGIVTAIVFQNERDMPLPFSVFVLPSGIVML